MADRLEDFPGLRGLQNPASYVILQPTCQYSCCPIKLSTLFWARSLKAKTRRVFAKQRRGEEVKGLGQRASRRAHICRMPSHPPPEKCSVMVWQVTAGALDLEAGLLTQEAPVCRLHPKAPSRATSRPGTASRLCS